MFSPEQTEALIQSFQTSLINGKQYDSILQARKQAETVLGESIKAGSPIAKAIDEVIESAVVRVARAKVADARTLHEAYDQLVDLLDRQPNLSVRSSTSIRDQAYSTPVAIGFLVAALAGVTPESTVYEPTAGRGALLLTTTPENAIVNEINSDRAADLRAQGYRVTEEDALKHLPPQSVDVVLMNPPFGTIRTNGVTQQWRVSGGAATPVYTTTQIDQAIVLKALTAMKDDGKAAIIIAAPMSNKTGNKEESSNSYNSRQNAPFWKSLYDNYNVTDHFCIAGELYARQGTTFPVDVVMIEGRSRSKRPYPAAELPIVYRSFDDLKERLPDGNLLHSHSRSLLDSSDQGYPDAATLRGSRSESDADRWELQSLPDPALGSGGLDDSQFDRTSDSGADLSRNSEAVERTPTVHDLNAANRGRPDRLGGGADNLQQRSTSRTHSDDIIRVSGVNTKSGIRVDSEPNSSDFARSMVDSTGINLPPSTIGNDMNEINNTPKQVAYQPQSLAQYGNTLVPTNLQSAMKQSLERLERRVGSIDGFVNDKVNLNTARIQPLAEQIDSAALIIDNLEYGEAFVLGDQTGIGKGLQLAEIAKAHLDGTLSYQSGRPVPNLVFVTYDSKLYADFLRDLRDVGIDHVNPLITNSDLKLDLPDGTKLRTGDSKTQTEFLRSITLTGDLQDHNIVFTTYSQLQTVKGEETARRGFFRAIAPDSLFIFDESHNAGGTKSDTIQLGPMNRADFVRQLVRDAGGVVFSSATYAKNPYTMTLYASRTGMRHAVEDRFSFDSMVQAGGVPMQQMIAAKLAESGQYIRRERSYEGISFDVKQVAVNKPIAENLSQVMQQVMQFDEAKQAAVRQLKKEAQKEAKQILGDGSTGAAGVSSTNFTSIMHNVIAQTLLALKADATVEETLQVLRNNEKPVIALYNTMGSIIERAADDQRLNPGDTIDLSVGDLLLRYLERSREVIIKDAFGGRTPHRLTDEELGIQALSIYEDTIEQIESIDWSQIPISPIDHIRQRLEAEGYRTAEITGRTDRIQYQDGQQIYQTRLTKERGTNAAIKNVSDFNNGTIDVILLNRSGSTGISLHASERFADQRPRHMMIAQPDLDINQFMQTLGRTHRTGQVELPNFSLVVGDIPAEKRPGAVLAKKMASLNANTTAARDSSFSLGAVVDFLNEYGDQVAVEVVANYPDLHKKLGRPIAGLTEDADLTTIDTEGAIAKITGRIPLLSLAEQERIYSILEREYTELVERERAMGNNILEAETADLAAKTLARMEMLPAKEGINSPFADAVYLEVVEVKSPRKPHTSLEVVNLVRQELDLPLVDTLRQHNNDDVEERGRDRANQTITELGQKVEQYRECVNAKHIQTGINEDDPTKAIAKIDYFNRRLDAQVSQVRQNLELFPVGQPVTIVNYRNMEFYYGVVQQVESRADIGSNAGSNPSAPSMWRLRLQVADSAQQIVIPFSKINVESLSALRITPEAENWQGVATIDQFDLRQTDTRERRQMFTGNVIRAAEKFNGKLLNYTTEDGQIRQGMLMSRSFVLDKALDEQPVLLPSPTDCGRFFAAIDYHGTLKTADQLLSVMECKDGTLKLTTESSKQKGSKYYLDDGLLAAAGSEFVQSGVAMSMTVDAQNRERVYDYIYENYGKLRTFSQQDKARELLGLEKPSFDTIDALLSQLPPHVEMKDPGADAIRLESLLKLEAEPPKPSKTEPQTSPTIEAPVSKETETNSSEFVLPAEIVANELPPGEALFTETAVLELGQWGKLTSTVIEFEDFLYLHVEGLTANYQNYPNGVYVQCVPREQWLDMDAELHDLRSYVQFAAEARHSEFQKVLNDECDRISPELKGQFKSLKPDEIKQLSTHGELRQSLIQDVLRNYPNGERVDFNADFRACAVATVIDKLRAEQLQEYEVKPIEPSISTVQAKAKLQDVQKNVQDTPAAAVNSVATRILPPAQQTGKPARNIARFLDQAGLAEAVLGGTDDSFHLRIENEPYLPLVVERHRDQLYLTHYTERNGDLIHDGEMVFAIDAGHLKLSSTAVQDWMRGGEHRACDHRFAAMFSENILCQGFADAANAAYRSSLETIQTTNETTSEVAEQLSTEALHPTEAIGAAAIDIATDIEERTDHLESLSEPIIEAINVTSTELSDSTLDKNSMTVIDTPIENELAESQSIDNELTSELEQNSIVSDSRDTIAGLPEVESDRLPVLDPQFFTVIDFLPTQDGISFHVDQIEPTTESYKAQSLPTDSLSTASMEPATSSELPKAPIAAIEWQLEGEEITVNSSSPDEEVSRSSVVSDPVSIKTDVESFSPDAAESVALLDQVTSPQTPVTLEDLRDWYRMARDIGRSGLENPEEKSHLKRIEEIGKAFRFEQQPLNARQLEMMAEDKALWTAQAETIANHARSILTRENQTERLAEGTLFRGKQYIVFETEDRLYVTAPNRGVQGSESDRARLSAKALPPNYGIILKEVKGEIDLKATTVANADEKRFGIFAQRSLVTTTSQRSSTSYER